MLADEDPAAFNARIEALTRALDASPDVEARRSAGELVRLVLQFHGAALRRLVPAVAGSPPSIRQQIAADPVVAGVMALHGLEVPEPVDTTGRVEGAPVPLRLIQTSGAITTSALPRTAHEGPSHCEQCGAALGDVHHHHVDLVSRRLSCACRACWLLSGAHAGRRSLRAVPDRYVNGPSLRLTDVQWDALQVPVSTAFFMFNTAIGRTIAFYPSPVGATESALRLDAWREVEQSNPWVRAAAPDVEAVLMRRHPAVAGGYDAFIVPIDACYDLAGRIRLHWSGFDGGDGVRCEIDRFFDAVAARSAGASESVEGRA